MKIKADFITNSSSACFFVAVPKDTLQEFKNYISDLDNDPDACNEGVRYYWEGNSLKELQRYTNDGPLDWASLPGGPQFINVSEKLYNKCKKQIDNGNTVIEVTVDYNVCEKFVGCWEYNIIEETS